jgi:hypothetical protein
MGYLRNFDFHPLRLVPWIRDILCAQNPPGMMMHHYFSRNLECLPRKTAHVGAYAVSVEGIHVPLFFFTFSLGAFGFLGALGSFATFGFFGVFGRCGICIRHPHSTPARTITSRRTDKTMMPVVSALLGPFRGRWVDVGEGEGEIVVGVTVADAGVGVSAGALGVLVGVVVGMTVRVIVGVAVAVTSPAAKACKVPLNKTALNRITAKMRKERGKWAWRIVACLEIVPKYNTRQKRSRATGVTLFRRRGREVAKSSVRGNPRQENETP